MRCSRWSRGVTTRLHWESEVTPAIENRKMHLEKQFDTLCNTARKLRMRTRIVYIVN